MRRVLIDASAVAYWRHFAREKNPHADTAAEWTQRFLDDANPDEAAICFDSPTNWRTAKHSDYKAHRAPRPDGVKCQIDGLRNLSRAAKFEVEGFEADDIIAGRAADSDAHTIIVASDKDLLQIVSPTVLVFDPVRNKTWDGEAVAEKWGVLPTGIRMLLALMGDASDGLAGVPGIGAVKAAQLVNQGQTIGHTPLTMALFDDPKLRPDDLCESVSRALRELVIQFADRVRLNYELIGLRTDCFVSSAHDGEVGGL